jgi:hypothetical protein
MRPFVVGLALLASGLLGLRSAPVEFAFQPQPREGNPFARELWAEVIVPSGVVRLLPAFYRGDGIWAVRARPEARGIYRLGEISESSGIGYSAVLAEPAGGLTVDVQHLDPLGGPVRIDPRAPRLFVDDAGRFFYPLGANLPWAVGAPDEYFPAAFRAAREAGMNWARVWMAHWGQLNLDWRDAPHGASPPRGNFDLDAAARWDRVVTCAEENGLRLQVVLQHHGQYSSLVNSNWAENPWNVANGGFLSSPIEFFTSAEARRLTAQKYRYIVARWGYSSAIFAWELFNEVKWTDARTGAAATPETNAAVAAWHAEFARHIRRLDTYGHLVTTSDDSVAHPLYAAMDFLQPHLYAADMLSGVRRFDLDAAELDRPIFYGEVGDDNMTTLPPALRNNGYSNLPLAWAGLMNDGVYAAQIWYAQRLLDHGGLGGFGALAKFVRASGLDQRTDLRAFSPAVRSEQRMPFTLGPGAHWHRQSPPTVRVPFDGSAPAELGALPNSFAWAHPSEPKPEPFPHEATLLLNYPRDATAVLRFAGASVEGGSIRVTLDGQVVGEHLWPAIPPDARKNAPARPMQFVLPMKRGLRTLVISNPHGPDWVEFQNFSTGLDIPVIAAVGRRSADRIVLWFYHRQGVWAVEEDLTSARAHAQLADVATGRWRVTWWDTAKGEPASVTELSHAGGALELETPPIRRYAAVWLEKL